MNPSRRTLSVLTVVVLVVLVGGGIWWRLRPEPEGADGAQSTEADSLLNVDLGVTSSSFSTDVPTPVEGTVVLEDTLWIKVAAPAKAEAYQRTAIASQVAGVIESVPVRENSAVPSGGVLIQIDTVELAMAVAQERAGHRQAEAQFQTIMLQGGEITNSEVARDRATIARASSGLDAAEVALRRAEIDLSRATVTAPFGGRVADLQVVPGQYISAGTELMTLVDLNPIKVEADVLEAGLGSLQEGRTAAVRFAAFPGEEFTGRVASINPLVDPEQRVGRVTILIDNPTGKIKPGMYADVSIEARSFPDRVIVPRAAILERGEPRTRKIVFVFEPDSEGSETGVAVWRYVATGEENDTHVEIVSTEDTDGVQPGETVLIGGHHYIAHDVRVRLVESVIAAGGRPGA